VVSFHSHKARALLVADPDCPPDLLDFARDLLVTGGTGPVTYSSTGTPAHYEEMIERDIADQADLVIVLRTQPVPSREVLTAVRIAEANHRAVHVLVVRGLPPKVDADEYHIVELVPPAELGQASQELLRWAAQLPKRYGHPL
jgi:hypothetical protein